VRHPSTVYLVDLIPSFKESELRYLSGVARVALSFSHFCFFIFATQIGSSIDTMEMRTLKKNRRMIPSLVLEGRLLSKIQQLLSTETSMLYCRPHSVRNQAALEIRS
jgi:hypothetical protein